MDMRLLFYFRYIGLLVLFMQLCDGAIASESFLEGQRQRIDSMKTLLVNRTYMQKDEVVIYHRITVAYAAFEMDSTILYARKTLSLAKKANEKKIMADVYCHLGAAYCFKCDYDSAYVQFDQAYKIGTELKDENIKIRSLTLYAFAYSEQGKYATAMDRYLKMLPLYEKVGNVDGIVTVLANLSEISRKMNNTEMAAHYLKQAEKECEELKKDPWKKDDRYRWRITQIYNEYAAFYLESGNLELALEYALKSDSINQMGVIDKCYTQSLLATIYLKQNDYDQALQYAGKAMYSADILKDKSLYLNAGKALSDAYLAQKRYQEAEAEAIKAWQVDSTDIDESRGIAKNIALANIYLNNTEKAAYYLEKYSELNKQYSEKSFHVTMADMVTKYETDKKEMRIASLERQKMLYILIGIVAVLLIVALWINFQLQIQEKQLIESRAMLEGEKEERRRLARDLHDGLGGMLSAVKLRLTDTIYPQDIQEKLDDCIEETGRIAHHLMPASLSRYGMKAALEDYCCSFSNVHFHFFGEDKRINEHIELTIYYCAYELVNNSFKHSGATIINVQLIQEDEYVSLSVQDNGCGFDKESAVQGTGLKNINDRIIPFEGKIDISTLPGMGMETNIQLKIEK